MRRWLRNLWRRLMAAYVLGTYPAAAPANAAPTNITFTGLSHADNATAGTVAANGTVVDADSATMNSITCSNSKYEIANISGKTFQIVVSAAGAGNFTPGTESSTVTATDSSGNPFTSGSQTITVTDHLAATLLTTMTLNNPEVSAQSANVYAAEAFHYFPKAAIPSGSHLEVRANDGTTKLRALIRSRIYWPDSSLMGASIVPMPNAAVSAGGTLPLKLYKTGTAHGTSGIVIGDVTAAKNINVQGESVSGLAAATWTSSFNDAVANGTYWIEDDSEGGLSITAYDPFNNGSSDSLQAGCWFYLTVLRAAAGGIDSYLLDVATHNGWHDETGAAIDTIIFKDLKVRNSSTTLRTMKVYPSAMTFTRATATTFTVASTTDLKDPNCSWIVPIYLTNSGGALPTGLTANVGYWLRVIDGTTVSFHASLFDARNDTGAISTSAAGSGTHTLNPAMWLDWYDPGKLSRDSDCKPIFLAGTQSEAPKCIPTYSAAYLSSTGLYGPRDLAITATALAHKPYYHGAIGSVTDDFVWGEDQAGERTDIGFINAWGARGLHVQSTDGYKRLLRNAMLYVGLVGFSYMRKSTFLPLNTDSGAHTGLGTAVPQATLRPSAPGVNGGVNAPASYSRMPHAGSPHAPAHASHPAASAYEMCGAPAFLHLLHSHASRLILSAAEWGSETIGATTYSPTVLYPFPDGVGQWRNSGWSLLGPVDAYRLTPASHRGSALKEMYGAMVAMTADHYIARQGTLTSFMQTNKFPPQGGTLSTWQTVGYFGHSILRHYMASEDPDVKTVCESLLVFMNNNKVNITSAAPTFVHSEDIWNSFYHNSVVFYTSIDEWADVRWDDSGLSGHQKSYIAMVRSFLKWCNAAGFTVPSGMMSAMDAKWTSYGSSSATFTDDPVYAMGSTF